MTSRRRSSRPPSAPPPSPSRSSTASNEDWKIAKGILTNPILIQLKYLLLMLCTPPIAIMITHASKHLNGDMTGLILDIFARPMLLVEIWPSM